MHEKEVRNTICPTLLESHLVTHTQPILSKKHSKTSFQTPVGHTETPAVMKITIKQSVHKENNGKTTKAGGEPRSVSGPADTWAACL